MKRGVTERMPSMLLEAKELQNILNGCRTTDVVYIERPDGQVVPAVSCRNSRDGKLIIKAWNAGDGR